MSHKFPEPYSGKNPVPQIATKLTALVNPKHATAAKAAQLQDQTAQADEKQTEKRASRLAKGYAMRVVDPVTGDELDIKNADEEPDLRSKGENVLSTDFPPPNWNQHAKELSSTVTPSMWAVALTYIACFLVSRLISSPVWSACTALAVPTILTFVLNFRVHRIVKDDFDDRAWHSERMRGLQVGSDINGDGEVTGEERIKESAEWVNAFLRGVWPIMNPDLFGSVVDIIEDIMQASVPHFVHSVRIADLGLGSNAARITAIRSLPDAEHPEFGGQAEGQRQSEEEHDQLSGQHVNVEMSYVYRGLPSGQSAVSKAQNIHLVVEFFVGIRGLYAVKVPAWVEVTGAVGTARARLQLISDPPFVKHAMITLLGLPRITISVVALHRVLPNIMNLPFISGFVSSAINTAAAEYVAPKSLTFDLQKLIRGDDVKKDTDAFGVLIVHIHRAVGVRSMDANGKSDPYLTVTYSRLEKPLYSTRIIKENCNPVFEETAFILVDVNIVRLKEKLSLQLWDSDRMSVDDLLGVAEVNIIDLIRHSGRAHRRSTPLSDSHSKRVPGVVEYTVGFYAKRPPTESFKTSGIDPAIPEDLRDRPEFQNARETAMSDLEAAVLVTPPDPEWPSGIISVQIHEIRGLGVKREGRERSVLKSAKTREGEKGQDDNEGEMEEMEGLPSSYCTISLNDELIYQTRVKPITSSPIFNAGTERFLKDWRTAHVSVTVKDSRLRENDAILGVAMLRLADLLVNASQITRLFSLEQGLGYGRIRLSVLFRPIEAKLPPSLIGFDTGTVLLQDIAAKVQDGKNMIDLSSCAVRIKTTKPNQEVKISRKTAQTRDDGSVAWLPEREESNLKGLPVRSRYSAALHLSFKAASTAGGFKSGRKALAVLWLRDIGDNNECTVQVPLWHAVNGDYSRLKRNYTPPDGNLDAWDKGKDKFKRVGSVWMHLTFVPGISEGHRDTMKGSGSKRQEAWEAYVRELEGGLRDSVGETVPDLRDKARRPENFRRGDGPDSPRTPETSFDHSGPSVNTMVPSSEVEHEQPDGEFLQGHPQQSTSEDSDSDRDEEKGKGVVQRFKDWRQHEKRLHREHRGVMQLKPARTVEWIRDNVEEGAHSLKERFTMKNREPDVETEV